MAHLGRRLRNSSQRRSGRRPMTGSVIDQSQLPSPAPSGSYHLEPFLAEPSDQRSMTDSILAIRAETSRCVKIREFLHTGFKYIIFNFRKRLPYTCGQEHPTDTVGGTPCCHTVSIPPEFPRQIAHETRQRIPSECPGYQGRLEPHSHCPFIHNE